MYKKLFLVMLISIFMVRTASASVVLGWDFDEAYTTPAGIVAGDDTDPAYDVPPGGPFDADIQVGTDWNFQRPRGTGSMDTVASKPGFRLAPDFEGAGAYGWSINNSLSNAVPVEAGTVEFWIAPDWNGINQGGSGIGDSGSKSRWVTFGQPTDSLFSGGIKLSVFNNNSPNDGGQVFVYWKDTLDNYAVMNNNSGLGSTQNWTAGSWHHIAFSWNTSNLYLFLDGILLSSTARPSAAGPDVEDSLEIGGYVVDVNTVTHNWIGRIDDLAISDVCKYTANFTPPASPVVPEPIGLTAYMNYDRNSLPIVANEPNLTVHSRSGGHYVIADAGKIGFEGALQSDVSDPGWTCYWGDNYTKTFSVTEGTVELWIAPDWNGTNQGGSGIGGSGATQQLICLGTDRPWTEGLEIFIFNNNYPNDGGQLFAYWKDSNSQDVTFNNSTLEPSGDDMYGTTTNWQAGQWHHVAFCWDVNTLGFYLNGGIVKEANRPSKLDGFASGMWVGGYSNSGTPTNVWDGKIDDLGIWDQAKYIGANSVPADILQDVDSELLPSWTPNPSDTTTHIELDRTLSWLPGYYAVKHDVYFGTNFNDVNTAADYSTSPGKGRQTSCTYDPGTLSLNTTYYWRIDEVNDANGVVKGDVWSFTTTDTDLPNGFRVLGTVPPAEFNEPEITAGYTEQDPCTNTTPPTWTADELEQNYVVFTQNWLELVYPSTRPTRGQISDEVNIVSIAGEYEAASFAIHTMNDVNLYHVSTSVTDLTSGSGADTIDANFIDIRTVRCWPRKVWDEPKYIVTPSFMEKRDSVTIDVNNTQQYLVTVYIPYDANAGNYTGTITITADDCTNHNLTLNLEVMPLTVQTPNTEHGMYYNPADVNAGTPYQPLDPTRVRNDITNMKEHGMNTTYVSIPPKLDEVYKPNRDSNLIIGFDPMHPFGEACQRASFGTMIYNTLTEGITSNPEGSYGTMVAAAIHGFENKGWPTIIVAYGDETDAAGQSAVADVNNHLNIARTIAPDTNTYTTIAYPENLDYFEPNCTMRAFSSYIDDTVISPTRAAGREVWQYSGASGYGIDPEGDRLYRGIWASKLTLDGIMDWTYWMPVLDTSQPYQDLISGATRNNLTCWVFPGDDGPLNSLGWEAMREGIEDEKYIYTLKQKIIEAENSGKDYLESAALDANDYLDSLYADVNSSPRDNNSYFPIWVAADELDVNFYDDLRFGCAQQIQNIENAGVTAYWSFDVNFEPDIAVEPNLALQSQGGSSGSHTIGCTAGQTNFGGAMVSEADAWTYYEGDDYTDTFDSNTGTIEFWIAPDWNGTNQGGSGIGGSGAAQELINAGGDRPWVEGLEIFIFNNNSPNDGGQLFAYWKDSLGNGVIFEAANGGGEGYPYGSTKDWTNGEWHHIAFCWDTSNLRLFLDGKIVDAASRPSSADGFGIGLWIGGHTTDDINGINTWDGKIDDLTIWRETRYTSTFTVPKMPVYYNY